MNIPSTPEATPALEILDDPTEEAGERVDLASIGLEAAEDQESEEEPDP